MTSRLVEAQHEVSMTLGRIAVAASVVVLVSSCSGGGGGAASSCDFVRGSANYSATPTGSVDNVDAVGDGRLETFAKVSTGPGAGVYVDTGGTGVPSFPAGSNAGVFVTPPSGISDTDVTISTFVDEVSQTGETATGPALKITPTSGDPATDYISFTTTAPFNGIKLTINTPNSTSYLVYEFCGSATVR